MINEQEIYNKIIQKWGIESQLGLLQEECAEVIKAVNKLFRNSPDIKTAKQHLCEELGDVQNMINQIKGMFPESEFENMRISKLERIQKILEEPNNYEQ